jgi:RNA polymerase sigma-32 factor
MSAMQSSSLVVRDPWAMVPSLGNLEAYITACHQIPMLTAEDEANLSKRLKQEGDVQAAGRLVLSHLRLVISVARQYLGYGLAHADLIQEGNVGLMKAVKRFDPDQGVRLVTYAMHWIKAEIHEYVIKNWRLVKIATTKAQRKLFFNLRSMKKNLRSGEGEEVRHEGGLTYAEVNSVARRLNVSPQDVLEMETRMAGGDVALESPAGEGEEAAFDPIHYLKDEAHEPTRVLEGYHQEWLSSGGLQHALDVLDVRSRRIVEQRWLNSSDDEKGGATLHELADEFGVSAERIRQIESAALKKMRTRLLAASNTRSSEPRTLI